MAVYRFAVLYCFANLLLLANATFNFAPYPACAQTYLYKYAPDSCDYGNLNQQQLYQSNSCLCKSSTFLDGSARGTYKYCGCAVLKQAANMMVLACSGSGVTPMYDADGYVAVGDGGQSKCVDPSDPSTVVSSQRQPQTTSSPPTPTSSEEPKVSTTEYIPATTSPYSPEFSAIHPAKSDTTSSPSATGSSESSSTISGLANGGNQSNAASDEGVGLQKSANRIALGCGIGIGVPTFLVGLWACLRYS